MRYVFGVKTVVAVALFIAGSSPAAAVDRSMTQVALDGVRASASAETGQVASTSPVGEGPTDEARPTENTQVPAEVSSPSDEVKGSTLPKKPSDFFRSASRNEGGKPGDEEGAELPGGDWLRMVGWLIFIIVLVYVLAVIMRKVAPGSARMFTSQAITVMGRTFIAPRQSLMLVEIGKRLLVLAVTPQSVTLVTEISDPEEMSLVKQIATAEKSKSISSGFKDIFRRTTRDTRRTDQQATADSLPGLKEDLDELLRRANSWRQRHGGEQ